MLGLKWFPVRFLIRRVARAQGFLDPVAVLARLRGFTQPSEVGEPIELLRAGLVMHARGLVNARVIQHNLDWVWPHWVERQFDPADDAFVPRAFSITHINLTHRNWTAVGLPDVEELPIVDPRGLFTPRLDGWSLDCWLVSDDGDRLVPSRANRVDQWLEPDNGLAVETETRDGESLVRTRAWVEVDESRPVCRLRVRAESDAGGWLTISLRPANPEGVSFIHRAELSDDRTCWRVAGDQVIFSEPVTRNHISPYTKGDVFIHLADAEDDLAGECPVEMLTAAAMFRADPGVEREVTVTVPLGRSGDTPVGPGWRAALAGHAELTVPDRHITFLYDAAIRTLILHSPHDVWPGPYTYKRFWFRDAALIINALLAAGLTRRAARALDGFPHRQKANGYFHSQDGEWDSNGEALWIMRRYCALSGAEVPENWWHTVPKAARWIAGKRLQKVRDLPHAGLLPAGFSAEHLGPNDYYYWDDFWGVAGLEAAAWLADARGETQLAEEFRSGAAAFMDDVVQSLAQARNRIGRPAMPASPYRRLDAGAIGSLAAGFPLELLAPDDPALIDSVNYLLENHFYGGGFFQDMTHSGINAYLTLHVAQVLLRAGDARAIELVNAVARLASPTGQWPEAIHPRTLGGCMGDGQHVWAAAEWVVMLRNMFVRDEGEALVLGAGIAPEWLEGGEDIRFGPAPTPFGPVTVRARRDREGVTVTWDAVWRGAPPEIRVELPGHPSVTAPDGVGEILVGEAVAP
ncbi:MAG: hypothetical protein OEY97_02530 [Nitrospirota bacterium]|nr:hypothetical protein [Nitrospirota bacterium]